MRPGEFGQAPTVGTLWSGVRRCLRLYLHLHPLMQHRQSRRKTFYDGPPRTLRSGRRDVAFTPTVDVHTNIVLKIKSTRVGRRGPRDRVGRDSRGQVPRGPWNPSEGSSRHPSLVDKGRRPGKVRRSRIHASLLAVRLEGGRESNVRTPEDRVTRLVCLRPGWGREGCFPVPSVAD